jgi:hypothetical protein
MTMPYGSVEEPEISYKMGETFPAHVVSSDLESEKSVGTEFGYWRTLLVNSVLGPQRLCSRSPRRKRLLIGVFPTIGGGASGQSASATGTAAAPAANGTVASVSGAVLDGIYSGGGLWLVNWSTELIGAVADPADRNNMYLSSPLNTSKAVSDQPAVAGTVIQPPYLLARNPSQGINVQAVGAATAGTTYGAEITATLQPQSLTDGVLLGSRDFANNSAALVTPYVAGVTGGGFIPVGQSTRWECQAELWVAFPPSNTGAILVTVCDEQYASD